MTLLIDNTDIKDILEEIKSIRESPVDEKLKKEIQDIMEKEKCSFVAACIVSVEKILEDSL